MAQASRYAPGWIAMADMPPIIGWRQVVSPDNTTLVQVYTDLQTGLIESVYIAHRKTAADLWEPLQQCEIKPSKPQ